MEIKKEDITQKLLMKLLSYNTDTGIFTWIDRTISMFTPGKYQLRSCNIWNINYANKEAGNIWTGENNKTSYLRIGITLNGKTKNYQAHRLAILYTDGYFPPEDVDHIDGNGLNNRRNNLREVTAAENHKNRPMQSNNTSGAVGVCWHKKSQKWQAYIRVNGKAIYGGCFANKEDAIEKRKQMEIERNFHQNHGRK